jgi:hypothetical protein
MQYTIPQNIPCTSNKLLLAYDNHKFLINIKTQDILITEETFSPRRIFNLFLKTTNNYKQSG